MNKIVDLKQYKNSKKQNDGIEYFQRSMTAINNLPTSTVKTDIGTMQVTF